MRQNSDLLITPEHTNASSCLQSFIDKHLILLDAFAEGRAHVLWWVGDDINLSTKFLLELMGEFRSRAECWCKGRFLGRRKQEAVIA